MKWTIRISITAFLTIWLSLVVVAFTNAQTGSVDIPLERRHTGDPGELFLEAEISATNEIGWTCGAFLERRNNKSVHPGTNVIIESGANTVTFTNIESEAFEEATKAFVIDGDILVFTQIGEDGISSMGYLLEFECNPPTTTTTLTVTATTQPPSSTTTTLAPPPSTVPPVTTTTEPPPINGIDTGGGAMSDVISPAVLLADGNGWLIGGLFLLALGLILAMAYITWDKRQR